MNEIQTLHQQAMHFAEQAEVAKLRGATDQVQQLLQQAFEQEAQAAALIAADLTAEPTRSVLHRSAAALEIDCDNLVAAEHLIAIALSGQPPAEIAAALKDLFVQINLLQYFARRGWHFDTQQLTLSPQ
jgi:hypothetical protein